MAVSSFYPLLGTMANPFRRHDDHRGGWWSVPGPFAAIDHSVLESTLANKGIKLAFLVTLEGGWGQP